MRKIRFVENIFDEIIMGPAYCACQVHDWETGQEWVGDIFIEVVPPRN